MKRRFALWGLSFLPVCFALDFAQGGQTIPTSLQQESLSSCGIGCTHFEGYVIVPRRPDASPETVARHDAVLSANRLYLPAEDEKTP